MSWKRWICIDFQESLLEKYREFAHWYVENMGENSYYEKMLGSLVYYQECDIRCISVPKEMWCEIDDYRDLIRA